MTTKITVNGIAYDSVEAMPPDVRRTYEQALAKFPDLADREGGAVPEVIEGHFGPLHYTTTLVRKRFVVNGTSYDNEEALPAEARQAYHQAMRAGGSNASTAKKDMINVTFEVSGPGGHFGKRVTTTPRRSEPVGLVSSERDYKMPSPMPIEPSGASRFRIAFLFAIGVAIAIGFFLYISIR